MAFTSLVFYLFAVLVRPHEWGIIANEDSSIIRNSLVLCLLAFIFQKNKNLTAPQLPLMLALVLLIFISVATSGWVGGGIIQAEKFLRTAFIPFLMISSIVDSLKKQYIFFALIIFAAMLMVVNGIVQINNDLGIGLMGNRIYTNGSELRITYLGFLSDPNDLGMFLVMSLPLFFFFNEKIPAVLSPITWLSVPLLLYGMYLTNSRGTLLAGLSLLFFWFWRKYGTVKSIYASLPISPAILYIMSSFREIDVTEENAQGRLEAWYEGFQMFRESPIFGIGHEGFTDYYRLTAHNSFVLAFAELGIVGCLTWVGLLVVSIMILHAIAKQQYLPDQFSMNDRRCTLARDESRVANAMLYSFAAYMVSGFFLSRTYVPILYLFLGMCAATYGRVRKAFPEIEANHFFDIKRAIKYTFVITFSGIIGVNLLLKLFL